jgi:osmotically-inducible protein OsmY
MAVASARESGREVSMKSAMTKILLIVLSGLIVCLCGCGPSPEGLKGDDAKGSHHLSSDAFITARIKTAFIFNRHLDAFRINVDTDDGRVTLAGVVPTGIQKDLAGEIAKNADGVVKVDNRLEVTDGKIDAPDETERTFSQKVTDATTTASVKLDLAFASGVKASEIHVSTRWGTVTLQGTVGTKAERGLAVKIAEDAAGVKEVVDEIQVRG